MNTNKPDKELTDRLKKDLKDVKTKEELDALASSAGIELSDNELDAAAGVSCPGYNGNQICPQDQQIVIPDFS